MTSMQLARRMGLTQSAVTKLEEAESTGSITLARLERTAEALGCTLVYALVPNQSLDEIVHERARQTLRDALSRVDHTMGLEAQNLTKSELLTEQEELVEDMLRTHIRRIWDKP
jgi:predicted DNA-binding mobile mystery protein A